ncbi:SsrA-binding protein SmpB [Candidatus Saccharibacteria bacterium]|nr:SsrA-binding protein SmpB [Candidatus Saccharibacteria bacterium]
MAKKPARKPAPGGLVNKRARFDYELSDDIVAGLALTGPEVRAARDGHVQLKGAFVSVKNDELWLNNASFSLKLNEKGSSNRTVDTRPRKVLASRRQINQFAASRSSGMTIVPTKLLTTGKFLKVVIALGKGKKLHDKRHAIKKRDIERDSRHM